MKGLLFAQLTADAQFSKFYDPISLALGLDEAVLFGKLVNCAKYWHDRNELQDGFFFITYEYIENKIGLSAYRQRKAFNHLEEVGIIETKIMGAPPKKFYRIVDEVALRYMGVDCSLTIKDENSLCLKNGDEDLTIKSENSLCFKSENSTPLIIKNLDPNKNIYNKNKEKRIKEKEIEKEESAKADSKKAPKKKQPEKHRYGEWGNVLLSDRELELLRQEHTEDEIQYAIRNVDEYVESHKTKAKYTNFYIVIRKWGFDGYKKPKQDSTGGGVQDGVFAKIARGEL